jgi:hypothetical protein
MATFINLILKLEKKSGDSNSLKRNAATGSQLTVMASRQRLRFF